jgi:hypothetical protein
MIPAILKVIMLLYILSTVFQNVFGTPILSDSTGIVPTDNFEITNKIYQIPSIGLQITLPDGWNGINLNNSILISQSGVDIKTGEIRENNPVFMIVGYHSLDSLFKAYAVTTLEDYVQNTAKTTGCDVVYNEHIRVNGIDSYKVMVNCGSSKVKVENILNYYFISKENVIFVGLKGINPSFYRNIENFEESVKSIRINDSR